MVIVIDSHAHWLNIKRRYTKTAFTTFVCHIHSHVPRKITGQKSVLYAAKTSDIRASLHYRYYMCKNVGVKDWLLFLHSCQVTLYVKNTVIYILFSVIH